MVVSHQRQVALALAPGHLVDADLEQPLEAVAVKLVGADALDHPPDRAPVDAHQPGDRGLVGAGRQPRDERLEVTREVRPVARERHRLGQHPVRRADQPAQPRSDLQAPDTEIEMAPVRIDRPDVVAVRRAERAPRTDQPAATQRDRHHDSVALKANTANMHALQDQQRRECGADAHGTIDLQLAGFDTRDPTADPVRVSGQPLHHCKAPAPPANPVSMRPTSMAGAPIILA